MILQGSSAGKRFGPRSRCSEERKGQYGLIELHVFCLLMHKYVTKKDSSEDVTILFTISIF